MPKGVYVRTKEHKRKMSEITKKNMADPEARKRISESLTGRKRPEMTGDKNPAKRPEVRKKISEAHKGVKKTEEHKEKIRQTLTGRVNGPHSEETKRKIGLGNTKDAKYCKDVRIIHMKAFEMFGKSKCELCGMTLEEHREKWGSRFDMHYTLEPKDYKCMEPEAWETYCKVCHGKIDSHPENFGVV